MKTKKFFSKRLNIARRILSISLLLLTCSLVKEGDEPSQKFLSVVGLNDSLFVQPETDFVVGTIDFIDGIAGIVSNMETELSISFFAVLTAYVGSFVFNLIPNLILLIL